MEGLVTRGSCDHHVALQQPLLTGRTSVLCHSPTYHRAQLCSPRPPARTLKALSFQLWPKTAPPGKHLPLPVPLQPQPHTAPPPAPSGTRWLTDLSQAPVPSTLPKPGASIIACRGGFFLLLIAMLSRGSKLRVLFL